MREALEVGHPGDTLERGLGMRWWRAGANPRTKDLGKQKGWEGRREPVVIELGGSLQSLRNCYS